jgi:hypothetical protein
MTIPESHPDILCVSCQQPMWVTGDTEQKRTDAYRAWPGCSDCFPRTERVEDTLAATAVQGIGETVAAGAMSVFAPLTPLDKAVLTVWFATFFAACAGFARLA